MAYPFTDTSLDEVPVSVATSVGRLVSVHIGNPSATTGVYVKLYQSASAPTVASDAPAMSFYCPPAAGVSYSGIGSDLVRVWVAAAQEAGAGATAPETDPVVTIVFEAY
jgi:hypothetical protein